MTIMNLKVKESPITKSGVARIHINKLKKLGVNAGKDIAVTRGNGSILVHIYADELIEEEMISLRPSDRKKLKVKYGDNVSVEPFIGIRDKFKSIF
jgi:formylmethanofuran dehydrogenase subunit D